MAKSVQMARCAARVKRHTLMPSKVIRTEHGLYMSNGDYIKLRRGVEGDSRPTSPVDLVTTGAVPSLGGIPIYTSQACEPWLRFDGYPLRQHSTRYLIRHGQRHARGGRE